jgi:hypothetical protein
MKPFDYYSKPQIPCPRKADFTTVYVYDGGKVVWEGPLNDFNLDKLEFKAKWPTFVSQNVVDEEGFGRQREAYGKGEGRLFEEFKQDLFSEFNISEHPYKEKMFNHAWEKGHAHGYSEVYNEFEDLIYLLKELGYSL